MRNLCLIFFLFLSLAGYGQPDDVDSSGVGKPVGDAVTKTIGPEGGKISSADGWMELTFPPGALAAPTSIGIQPIENTSVMNFGRTYACTPDGIHFSKPVGLVIHYADSMAKGIAASIPVIRWQDKSGRWSSVEKISFDSVAHTIAGGIEHFSNYSAATTFKLYPVNSRIKVGKQQHFTLVISGIYPDGKRYSGRNGSGAFWKDHMVEWSVNGVEGGDDISGKIIRSAAPYVNNAVYTAPAVLPTKPVEIMAKYMGRVALADGTIAEHIITLATVDIYDEIHYSFTGYDKVGHLEMIDSSSCDIRAYSSGEIGLNNIQNYLPWSDWPERIGQCSYDYPDKTGWKGMVQIDGMATASFQRSEAVSPGAPASGKILVVLKPAMGSSPPYTVHCKGQSTKVPSFPVQANPANIQLEMVPSGGIYVKYGSAGGMNTYKDIHGGQGFSISASRLP